MENQIIKGVRLPRTLVTRIERIAEEDGSTFSQLVRTVLIKEFNGKKKVAA
jgi:metal-responsive CopG/Arc/MetJ family transcriptional regulator